MTTRVLICDDSAMARRHLSRNLPTDWNAETHFAVDGLDAVEQMQALKFDLLLLDLNMPNLDGYQVLAELQKWPTAPKVIVISADIQPLAQKRVLELGAMAMITKPTDLDRLKALLIQSGCYQIGGQLAPKPEISVVIDDVLREICNIAMGQAADNMAKVLDTFIELPIPKLKRLTPNDMQMLLAESFQDVDLKVVSQGFIGNGIAGEALLLFEKGSYTSMGRLMGIAQVESDEARLEVQMDIANMLFASFLNGLSQQLHIPFNQSHPVVLSSVPNTQIKGQTLAVEISYRLSKHNISCDLLLLFPQNSLLQLEHNLQYLVD